MEKEIIYTMSEGETLKFPVPEGMEDNNIDGLTTTVDVLNAVKDNIGKDNFDFISNIKNINCIENQQILSAPPGLPSLFWFQKKIQKSYHFIRP